MRRFKKHGTKIISAVLVLLMLSSLFSVGTLTASAANTYYYKYSVSGSEYYASSFDAAWTAALNNNGVVGIRTNVTCSTKSVTSNKNITLELNGYVLNRGRINSDSATDYNVISVEEGATLTVNGGTSSGRSVTVWKSGSTVSRTFYKGVITGGRNGHNGGGINIEKNATLNLNSTAVVGNRADDQWNTIGGYGGGIALRGDYAKLNMDNSDVSFNHAEVGGGICVRDSEFATITMKNSTINYNTATKEGGAVANSGDSENFKIKGDSNNTTTKSTMQGNSASNQGGGIYFGCESSVAIGVGLNSNTSSSAGGGVYMPKEKCSVQNCRIVNNTASGNGGGISNDNDNNTVENITVTGNKSTSGSGDGIYNYGLGNISMSGKCVVKSNTGGENLYLDYGSAQDEHYIIDSLKKGSEVYVTYASGHPQKLTKAPGTYDDSFYFSDTSGYRFKWYSREETAPQSGQKTRNIFRISGTKPSKTTPTTVTQRTSATASTYQGKEVIKGIYEFPASVDDTIDREATFYYSDGYFKESAKNYNAHLATLSSCMTMAAMYSSVGGCGSDSAEYRDKSNNIRQMMSDIGCKDEDIFINDNNVKRPTDTTIGVCIASKDIGGGEKLVIIGVRGGGYEAEWASNVSIGSSGEANGFKSAAETVFSELKSYLSRKGINGSDSKTKYWIAGYSRAGATANLTAKRVVDAYDTNGTRTFAYPIEAPKGALKSEATEANAQGQYKCIHNVLNFCDLVPWVAPGGMGFARYGVDHYVPGGTSIVTPSSTAYGTVADNILWSVGSSSYQTQKEKMLRQLKAMNDDIVYDDYFHMASINYVSGTALGGDLIAESTTSHSGNSNMPVETWIPKFWSAFQAWGFDYDGDASTTDKSTSNDWQATVTNGSKIRTNYSSRVVKGSRSFQSSLAYVMKMMFSMDSEKKENLLGCVDGLTDRIGTSKLIGIYTNFINKSFSGMIGSSDFDTTVEDIWTALTVLSTEDEAKGYHSITEYLTTTELNNLHSAFPALLYPILEFVANDYEGYSQDHAGTLAYNAMRLIQNHYPEVATSWIRSYDSYYDSDTYPVTLASTTGGKEAPHYPAVEIKNRKTGEITTTQDTTNVIEVGSLDEVRLVPNNASYKDKGEAIYYCYPEARYTSYQAWHGFSDPLKFGNISSYYYADSNDVYTIKTFSAHYDMAVGGTKTSGMTSAFDSTSRTYKFKINDYSTVAVPSSYSGTFPNGTYAYGEQQISYGDTYTTLSGVKPNNNDTWRFTGWTVYPYNASTHQKSGDTPVEDYLLTTCFGGTFDPTDETTEVTNLTNDDYLFEPSYVKVVSNLAVAFESTAEGILPSTVDIAALGANDVPVVWTYDNGTDKFKAVFEVTLPEGTELGETLNPTFSGTNASDISNPSLTSTVSGGTVRFEVSFNSNNTALEAGHSITVSPYDVNIGQPLEGESVTYNVLPGSDTVSITAPASPHHVFVGWLKTNDNGVTGTTISVSIGGNSINLVTESTISVPNVEGRTYYPYYKPVVEGINIKLSGNVVAGEDMPTRTFTSVQVGDEWQIDEKDGDTGNEFITTWGPSPTADGKAAYSTAYTVRYTFDTADGVYQSNLTHPDIAAYQHIHNTATFDFADDVTVNITDNSGNPISVQRTGYGIDGTNVYIDIVFRKTADPTVGSLDPVDLTFDHGTSAADIKNGLPDRINGILSDGSTAILNVTWGDVPNTYDPSALENQSFEMTGTITNEGIASGGATPTANVIVLEAPHTSAPVPTLAAGTYTGNRYVNLTADEGAAIKYAVVMMDPPTQGEDPNEPDFSGASYSTYTEPIDLAHLSGFAFGKEIYIQTYATKSGHIDSGKVTHCYIINRPDTELVESTNASIVENGTVPYYRAVESGTGTEEDPYVYSYYSDADGKDVISKDDIINQSDLAYISNTFSAASRTGDDLGSFVEGDYKAVDLLGVEKKARPVDDTSENGIRFITAVDSRILNAATDYGYVFAVTKEGSTKTVEDLRNQAAVLTVQNGATTSCKGTYNNLAGDYGNTVFTQGETGYTPYKYVTASVKNMNLAADRIVLARFYVRLEDGKTYIYATYNVTYDGCAVQYSALS